VTVDLSHVPISPDAWCALIDHALSLGDKCEVDYLELKGTLSFAKGDSKASAATIAKAILGMANRMPDVAELHLDGYGVVLVGIAGGVVTEAEEVDGADLRNLVDVYVGNDGPGWTHVYTHHRDGLVLAVVVHPPKWGDRIHAFRKQFGDYRDGTQFVRLPGATRQVTSHDLRKLEDRRERSSSMGAAVTVEFTGSLDLVDPDTVEGLVWDAINRTRDELLFGVDRVSNPITGSRVTDRILRQTSGLGENRSEETFRADVARWHRDAGESLDGVVFEVLRHHARLGKFKIANTSPADTYLAGVQVQVSIPEGFLLLARSESEYQDDGEAGFDLGQLLPQPPKKWGSSFGANIIFPTGSLGIGPSLRPFSPADASVDLDADDGRRMSWEVGDLPGRRSEVTNDEFALITLADSQAVELRWQATAKDVHHVFEGTTTVNISPDPGAAIDLRRLL
jgi:hypothetical protein